MPGGSLGHRDAEETQQPRREGRRAPPWRRSQRRGWPAQHLAAHARANAPAQRPWFRDTGIEVAGTLAGGRVGKAQVKAAAHRWRWKEIGPYLDRIAEIARNSDVSPIEFAERQQFLLTNPGFGGRLQVTSTIRCAVSIYNPGDVAPVHIHTPNASRTILSENGGYTTVEGERCEASRGDLILTPHGMWHDHGNDGATPVVWIDVLDFPLIEYLDCLWLDDEFEGDKLSNSRAQAPTHASGYSHRLYGQGGLMPGFVSHQRGIGRGANPMIHYRGADVLEALKKLAKEKGDPYEGISLAFVNPVTGAPVFPTLAYGAQLLRPGEETRVEARDREHLLCLPGVARARPRSRASGSIGRAQRHVRRPQLPLAPPRQHRQERRRPLLGLRGAALGEDRAVPRAGTHEGRRGHGAGGVVRLRRRPAAKVSGEAA